METQKILVTGGTGFIGSNLVRELKRRGHEVWACDLMNSGNEHYIRCDVSKYRQLESIFEEHKFDYVYHLAAEYGRWNGEDYYENLWMTDERCWHEEHDSPAGEVAIQNDFLQQCRGLWRLRRSNERRCHGE